MNHTIEPATSGRAKCRGCGQAIPKGELRLGERLPNPFAEGTEMTHWFHLTCAAMKRPEVFLETIAEEDLAALVSDRETLRAIAEWGVEHRRLPRIDGVERAPSGRATCRACRELIEKNVWRIKLVFYEEGTFNPAGFIHMACAKEYLGTSDIVDRLQRFTADLTNEGTAQIEELLQ